MVQILQKFDFLQILWLEACSFIYCSFQSNDINIYVNPGPRIVWLTLLYARFGKCRGNVSIYLPKHYFCIKQIFHCSKKTSRMLLYKKQTCLHSLYFVSVRCMILGWLPYIITCSLHYQYDIVGFPRPNNYNLLVMSCYILINRGYPTVSLW
jgi:hypothetical protein